MELPIDHKDLDTIVQSLALGGMLGYIIYLKVLEMMVEENLSLQLLLLLMFRSIQNLMIMYVNIMIVTSNDF